MSEEQAAVALAPRYYRANFIVLCDTVLSRYGDLLAARELQFLNRYGSVSAEAQCLYVRLVSRRGPWFRSGRLAYPEIGALEAPLEELLQSGLAVEAESLAQDMLADLFTVAELRRGFPELPGGLRKAELLEALAEQAPGAEDLETRLLIGERLITPEYADTVALLQVLFFGNRRQGLTDFVLSDLGIARYYPYRLEREQRLFGNREALLEYLELGALADQAWALREAGDAAGLAALGAQLAGMSIRYESSQRHWYRLCNRTARTLERDGELELAMALYRASELHPARERRARILEASGDSRGALMLCETIAREPWCEDELDAARRMSPRLRRQLGQGPARRERETFATDTAVLCDSGESVELQAAHWLARDWEAVHYVENTLMCALFGLAFWEQIFAPVAGAFHHPYQAAPADMYRPGFQQRRRDLLAQRMRQLRDADLERELCRAWDSYLDYQNRWVNWRYLDRDLVQQTARIMPAEHLLAIWQRILFDPGENRRGFPDLIALGPQRGEYRLLEVKGPGDTLQASQKRWLRFFAASDIPAGVLRVQWRDD